jgi:hypothetical protein
MFEGGAGGGLGKRELARNDDAVFTITTRSTHIHTHTGHTLIKDTLKLASFNTQQTQAKTKKRFFNIFQSKKKKSGNVSTQQEKEPRNIKRLKSGLNLRPATTTRTTRTTMQRQATMKRAVVVHFGSAPSFRGGDARWCAEDKEHKQTTMARGGVKRKKKKTTSLARGYSPRAARRAGAPIFFQTKRAPCLTQKKQNKEQKHNTSHTPGNARVC